MSKNKGVVNVTIDKGLLKIVDQEIKKFRFKSRSHALEYCVYQVLVCKSKK